MATYVQLGAVRTWYDEHGEGPITYQLMTDDTIAFLEAMVGQPADLVGHSVGAFVAMLVAIQRPELVKR